MIAWIADPRLMSRGARLVIGITTATLLALALHVGPAARLPLALVFYMTCPGILLLDWVRIPDAFTKGALVVTASLAVNILTVTLLLAAGAYSMTAGLAAVSAVAVSAAALSSFLRTKRLVLPAPKAPVLGGSSSTWPLVVAPPLIPISDEDASAIQAPPTVEQPIASPLEDLTSMVSAISTDAEWQIGSTNLQLSDGTPVTIVYVVDTASRACVSIEATTTRDTELHVWTAVLSAASDWGLPARLMAPARLAADPERWARSAEVFGFELDTTTPPTIAKRFPQTLRGLLSDQPMPSTLDELLVLLIAVTEVYNRDRPHSSLNKRTPRSVYDDTYPHRLTGVSVESTIVGRGGRLSVGASEVKVPERHTGQTVTTLTHEGLVLAFADMAPLGYIRLDPEKPAQTLIRWEGGRS